MTGQRTSTTRAINRANFLKPFKSFVLEKLARPWSKFSTYSAYLRRLHCDWNIYQAVTSITFKLATFLSQCGLSRDKSSILISYKKWKIRICPRGSLWCFYFIIFMKGIFIAKYLITYIVPDAISSYDDPPSLRDMRERIEIQRRRRNSAEWITQRISPTNWLENQRTSWVPSVGELFLDYETRMKAYNIHWEIFSATNSIISQEKKKLLTETRLDGNHKSW